jgi:hypothetical protein
MLGLRVTYYPPSAPIPNLPVSVGEKALGSHSLGGNDRCILSFALSRWPSSEIVHPKLHPGAVTSAARTYNATPECSALKTTPVE